MKTINPELIEAYRQTNYVVQPGNAELVFKVEQVTPELDALLARKHTQTAALLTAFNTYSQPRSPAENQQAQQRMQAELEALGLHSLPAEGRDPTGQWPAEQSVFVLDIAKEQATTIAKRFGQNAYVWVESGSAPELVISGNR